MIFYERQNSEREDFYVAYPFNECSWPLHFHRSFELISVTSGSIQLTLDDRVYELHANETAIIFPNQLHAYKKVEDSCTSIVLFSPELIGHFSTKYKGLLPNSPILKAYSFHAENVQYTNYYQKKAFLYQMCGLLTEHTDFFVEEKHTVPDSAIFQILSYIDAHETEDCTLSALANELGYDYTYVSRLFKNKIGLSFTEYRNQQRIRHACYLLEQTNAPISEIAFQCGYESLRSFHRNFKKITNHVPNDYRNT
ncbi:AraC family transcriptional regulator [Anaerosporobacter faecicola]|uniref:AraC family transcriptional regulator n=1 Tax=Anaerosporobacter faecicola TaxID=2718714 RepID=UPI001439BFB0|nr:AraC family transcriptional regulator [Anaerosporobacter faecicola]